MRDQKFKLKLLPDENKSAPSCACSVKKNHSGWVTGEIDTQAGSILRISTRLLFSDYMEHLRCRISAFRNNYVVPPGLYAVGSPDKDSDVLVSANYKLSFDSLRRELKGLNVWVLVLDTKGINVWCAAGKGTFGTDELIKRISVTQLGKVIVHRRIIVPQLGAPGVSAHKVAKAAGFKVLYGPVYAKDIPSYINAGYKATREMRRIRFTFFDRLVLTPMEINPAMKKFPWYALIVLALFGLQPAGIVFKDAFMGGLPYLLLGLISILAGALLTPALLPLVPFRAFAVKGWVAGMIVIVTLTKFVPFFNQPNVLLLMFTYLFFPLASSYIALQFTGATTFTGMSGVKKELRISIPVYIVSGVVSAILLTIYKLDQWRVI